MIFYGKTHSLSGKLLRRKGLSERDLQPAIQISSQENPRLPCVWLPDPIQSRLNSRKTEQATILSRSILSDGDVRFIVSVGDGAASTQRIVSLDELLDFVTLQQLHNFENTLFTQPHEADEDRAYQRHKRRGKFERSRRVERSAGYHGGVDDATSILQGPLVQQGAVRHLRGSSSRDSNRKVDEQTSDTTSCTTPVIVDDMRSMGVNESEHAQNTTHPPKPQRQENSSTLSQRKNKPNRSAGKTPQSSAAQSPSVSILSHSRGNDNKNKSNDAAFLLRQFKDGQVFGLDQQPRPLVRTKTSE